jgi:MoaA/NifB/PqqE/SkfB family radical SAM enzyme
MGIPFLASLTKDARTQSRLLGMYLRPLRMVAKNPRIVQTVLRAEYRKRIGIELDRRLLAGRAGFPSNISINLTRRCNLTCRMCIQHRHAQGTSEGLPWYEVKNELPISAWVRLLDQAMDLRPSLFVTGGEPTLHPDFPEFIHEAKRRRFVVHVATNGTTLARYSQLLVDEGVDIVVVSLDGPPDVHDRIRGQDGLFSRTTEGIRALMAERTMRRAPAPLVGINFAISRDNVQVIEQMVPVALRLGVDSLQFQHTIFLSRDHVEKHNSLFSEDLAHRWGVGLVQPSIPEGEFYESEIEPSDAELIAASLESVKETNKGRGIRVSFLPNLPEDQIYPYYMNLNHPFPGLCDTLWRTLRILPDGTVSPCLHVVAGNIASQSVREIWNGPSMTGFRQLLSKKLLPGCARCCNRNFV